MQVGIRYDDTMDLHNPCEPTVWSTVRFQISQAGFGDENCQSDLGGQKTCLEDLNRQIKIHVAKSTFFEENKILNRWLSFKCIAKSEKP